MILRFAPRQQLAVAALAAGLLLTSLACSQKPAPPRRPNVVLIVVDALRADHLPAYGYRKTLTPFLDRVASRGVVFERAHAASTWTSTSMASVFTGLYPNQHGVFAGYIATRAALNEGRQVKLDIIPKTAQTISEMLHGVGYRTYGISTNPNVSPRVGYTRGIDEFRELHYKATSDEVHAVVDGWREKLRGGPGPWFLYLHYMECHHPYKRQPSFDPKADDPEMSAYDSNIRFLDRRLSALFDLLRLHKDTLVIFTADHGEEFMDHGRVGHSNQLYSELLRVPLIVYWPGVVSARRVSDNVTTIDILPTLRDIVGLPADPGLGGVSVMPLLNGKRMVSRALFPMRARTTRGWVRKGVVFENWKYIVKVPRPPDEPEELYDLASDPKEKTNIAEQRPEVLRDMKSRLVRFEKTAKVFPREFTDAFITPEMAEGLKALGYVE